MNYCDCGDYCEWCHPEMCLPPSAKLRRPDGASNTLAQFQSPVDATVRITAERERGQFFVRLRRAGYLTFNRQCQSDRQAREKFERICDAHVHGQPLNTI